MPARKSLKDRNKAAITGPLEEPTMESATMMSSEPAAAPVVETQARSVGEQCIFRNRYNCSLTGAINRPTSGLLTAMAAVAGHGDPL